MSISNDQKGFRIKIRNVIADILEKSAKLSQSSKSFCKWIAWLSNHQIWYKFSGLDIFRRKTGFPKILRAILCRFTADARGASLQTLRLPWRFDRLNDQRQPYKPDMVGLPHGC